MKYNLLNDNDSLKAMFPSVAQVFDTDFLNKLEVGKTELNDKEYCIRTGYNMRPIPDQFFESHRQYIDIHITLSGSELFAVNNINELNVSSNYDLEGDCVLFDKCSPIGKLISSHPNDVVVFGVEDGHMTAIGDIEDSIEKVIVKVLVENISN